MERTLSLVLDEEDKISLTLMKKEANDIDDFTTKNFENSEQIRKYFEGKIEKFLEQNKNYIETISKKTGRKFRGRIVILEARELDSSIYFIEKRVLYKKHLVAFNEMIKDRATMLKFLQLEKIGFNQYGFRRLISGFLYREISYADYKVKSRVNLIKKEIKKNKANFYDILRIMTKAYEIERKKRNLPTIDAIYNFSKKTIKEENTSTKAPQDFYLIDGVFYPIDDIPFDLYELRHLDSEFKPDGLGPDERIR